METVFDYRGKIVNLIRELSDDKLRELIDFAQFLKVKEEGFTYMQIRDSAEYVGNLRIKEGKRVKSGREFIKEIVEWQKSNS